MTHFKKFLNNLALVLKDTRKAYDQRRFQHLLGS